MAFCPKEGNRMEKEIVPPEEPAANQKAKMFLKLTATELASKSTHQFVGYITVFLQELGFSPAEVGLLNSVNNFIGIFASPTWGFISDKKRSIKLVLLICFIVDACLFAFIPSSAGITLFTLPLVFIIIPIDCFFRLPANALAENWVVRASDTWRLNFGLIRSFGSLSYAIIGMVLGLILNSIGGVRTTFYLYSLFLVPVILICFTIDDRESFHGKTKSISIKEMQFGKLFKNYYYLNFLLFSAIFRLPMSCSMLYMPYLMKEIGVDTALIGVITAVRAFVEIPMMVLFKRLKGKYPLYYLIILSTVLFSVDAFILKFATNLTWLIIGSVFHGLASGLSLTAGTNYIYMLAPENLKATAQTLNGTATSVAGIIGAGLGGILIESMGASSFYMACGFLILGAGLIFTLSFPIGIKIFKKPAPGLMR